jgi:hypothetical protein
VTGILNRARPSPVVNKQFLRRPSASAVVTLAAARTNADRTEIGTGTCEQIDLGEELEVGKFRLSSNWWWLYGPFPGSRWRRSQKGRGRSVSQRSRSRPRAGKPILRSPAGLGSGVFEIALPFKGDAFRMVYAVQFAQQIWVVHAF